MNRLFFKIILSVVLTLTFNVDNALLAQISHGGAPLFYAPASSLLKSSGNNFFIEMPPFDVDSLLKEDKLKESNIRGSFRFAHKFYVNIEKGKTGYNYTLPDGTKVWQVGIRSAGAHSINVYFSEYKVPEGGKLFLYNSNKTHVIGSFTHENNSEDDILPIQPVAGDEIIVEYQEPADSKFEAKLKIAEINHDYKGLLNYAPPQTEPSGTNPDDYTCMPDVLCINPDNDNIRSVVLLIINGNTLCSGTLLNTTNNDGEPVVLTAVHCLNDEIFLRPNINYAKVAGTVVCFFNYRKPVCNQTQSQIRRMKGTEEMSIAGAIPLSIAIKNDMALLRLKNTPPDYYQPYYAGWNVNSNAGVNTPFINIHHPAGLVSKYGSTNTNLRIIDFLAFFFNPGSHWEVASWDIGSTAGGSSGSPLFDNQGLLVGGLSGGDSFCDKKLPDSFFALYKSWGYTPDVGIPLKNCLNPDNLEITQCTGYDPNKDKPLVRLKNGNYNNGDELLNSNLNSPRSGLVFGHNSIYTKEFAEEFSTEKDVELIGAYLLAPVTSTASASQIKVKAYSGTLSAENLVASEVFYPTYSDYSNISESFSEKPKTMTSVATESFVKFREEKEAGKKFYISYEITYPSGRDFSVFNMIFDSPQKNSAWLCDVDGRWFPATEHPYAPMSASLTIEPLVRYTSGVNLSTPVRKKDSIVYLKSSQQLQVNTDNPNEKGIINIYSLAGQLLYKIPYWGNNPVNIPTFNTGNIIIVKALSESGVKTCKIVIFHI